MTIFPSTGHKGSLNGLICMKLMQFISQISTQLHTCEGFWIDIFSTTIIKTPLDRSFGRMVFVLPGRFHRRAESMPRFTEVIVAADELLRSCYSQHSTTLDLSGRELTEYTITLYMHYHTEDFLCKINMPHSASCQGLKTQAHNMGRPLHIQIS